MAARPPAFSPESTISHEGPFYAYLVSRLSLWARDGVALERTMWLRRLAAPRPVGPMPMTRTSTLLYACGQYAALRKLAAEEGSWWEDIRVSHCDSWIETLSASWGGRRGTR